MATPEQATYFRKGFGLKTEVQETLSADYTGRLVDLLRARDFTLESGGVTVRLAKEFGFCYGVERAVEYAYQTRAKFPERRIFLAGEIIQPARERQAARDGSSPAGRRNGLRLFRCASRDVVILLPRSASPSATSETLRGLGCVVVDTTCGSVLNVWKRVESYARDGFTSLIHGKYYHEETRATASQVAKYAGGTYIVVRNMEQAREVCDFIEGKGLSHDAFLARYAAQASPHFDPGVHLARIGVANQTTMLARESLAIGDAVGQAIGRARGDAYRAANFRTFDTICSATQDRQDAVNELLREPLDAMLVIGGYNSSNTISLAALCDELVPTFHVADATCIGVESGSIRHVPTGSSVEIETAGWLPAIRTVRVGITAGASTPNNKIGEAVARIFATRGVDPASIA
jgi:4-hydroxy-3-methylbut-2-enyl diphosphate reductase